MKRIGIAISILLLSVLGTAGCSPAEEPAAGSAGSGAPEQTAPAAAPTIDTAGLQERAKAIFGPLAMEASNPDNPSTEARVDLGRKLYVDPRLSKNHDVSCNSCHRLDAYGVDGEPTSPGHKGQRGGRNSPTSFNAALHTAQFWDGRAADVEEQAKGPVLNPIEMAMPDVASVEATLRSIPGFLPLFEAAFPSDESPVTFDNMALAIAAFERKLMTPGRLDDFMQGDASALTGEEQRGLQTFMETGCITCHNGSTVGGLMFQKLGLVKPYETADQGRFEVTGNEADRHVFKVPSLRNVAKTGPWFHDGSIATLDRAVRLMAEHQLGKTLEPGQVDDIVAFLEALTAEPDAALVQMPELPESGPETPAPDPT